MISYFAALCYIYAEKCSEEIFLKYKCKVHVTKIELLITVKRYFLKKYVLAARDLRKFHTV